MNTFKKDGFLITLEGLEGCGKTTQALRLCEALRQAGHEVVHIKEPGGTPLAQAIREVVKGDLMVDAHVGVEVALMLAAKIDLYQRVVAPAILSGKVVVSERGWGSMFAYQTAARKISTDELEGVQLLAHASLGMDIGPYNHLQLLLDQSIAQQRARVASRNETQDHFERRGDDFFRQVHQNFARYFTLTPEIQTSFDTWEIREVINVEGRGIDVVAEAIMAQVDLFVSDYVMASA